MIAVIEPAIARCHLVLFKLYLPPMIANQAREAITVKMSIIISPCIGIRVSAKMPARKNCNPKSARKDPMMISRIPAAIGFHVLFMLSLKLPL